MKTKQPRIKNHYHRVVSFSDIHKELVSSSRDFVVNMGREEHQKVFGDNQNFFSMWIVIDNILSYHFVDLELSNLMASAFGRASASAELIIPVFNLYDEFTKAIQKYIKAYWESSTYRNDLEWFISIINVKINMDLYGNGPENISLMDVFQRIFCDQFGREYSVNFFNISFYYMNKATPL